MTELPLYRQIAEQLQQRMDSGELPPGSRLPPVRQLARDYGVNTLTALAAYRHLEQQQSVIARARAGFFAALPARHTPRPPHSPLPAAAALVDVSSRMNILLQLNDARIHTQLHMAEAAANLYPAQELGRRLQLALQRQPELIGAHLPQAEHWRLMHALQKLAAERGLDLPADGLLVTHGITEGISLALRLLTRPGDTVAVETPVYFGLLQTLQGLGLRVLEIPCTPDAGLSLEALEFALRHGPPVRCLVCVPHFQNPTGALMPEDNKKRLLTLARKHGLTLIEDDVFGDLHYGPQRPLPLKAWDRDNEVIYCASFTKSYAPSLRLGWLAGGRHHAALLQLKASSTLLASPLLQVVLADVLESGDYRRQNRILRQQLYSQMQAACRAVARYFPRGTRLRPPQGGLLLWLEGPENLDSQLLLQAALAEGISFAPGLAFSTEARFGHCLRINCGQPYTPAFDAALARLGALACQLTGTCAPSGDSLA